MLAQVWEQEPELELVSEQALGPVLAWEQAQVLGEERAQEREWARARALEPEWAQAWVLGPVLARVWGLERAAGWAG